jgi:ribosomal protein S1
LSLGDSIAVKVLKFDRAKKRVSLGLKQLHVDPWNSVIEKYQPGKKVRGKVTNITDYGAFIEIEPGIEGLVHISEMYWKSKTALPQRSLRVGQFVNVSVIDISKTRRRISLGMKQCLHNAWLAFSKIFRRNDKLVVTVRSLARLGVFVNLPMSLRGLLYLPRALRKGISQFHIKGEAIEASIVNINTNRKHISLVSGDLLTNQYHNALRCNMPSIGSVSFHPCFLGGRTLASKQTRSIINSPSNLKIVLGPIRKERALSVLSVSRGYLVSSLKRFRRKMVTPTPNPTTNGNDKT